MTAFYGVTNYVGAYYKPTQFPQNGLPAYAGDLNYQAPNNFAIVLGAITESGDTLAGTLSLSATISGAVTESGDIPAGTIVTGFAIAGVITEANDSITGHLLTAGDSAGAFIEAGDILAGAFGIPVNLFIVDSRFRLTALIPGEPE